MSIPPKWIAACVLAAAVAVAAATIPTAAEAQDVKYTEASKIEAFMSLPGMGGPIRSTTYVSKGRVRTDHDEQSTIMSYADGNLTEIDHSAKTYYTMSFADMMAAAQNAANSTVGVDGRRRVPAAARAMSHTDAPPRKMKPTRRVTSKPPASASLKASSAGRRTSSASSVGQKR